MGGEGTISSMIISLKNNNNLRRKRGRNFFENRTSRLKSKYKHHLKKEPTLSQEELLALRKKFRREQRIRDIKQLIALLLFIAGLILFLLWMIDTL